MAGKKPFLLLPAHAGVILKYCGIKETPLPSPRARGGDPRKRAEMIGKPHIKKADGDNIAKSILDSVNRVAFDDDSAIARLEVEKRYDEIPRVEVYITEWENER